DFITRGGSALSAYPEYNKLVERDGVYVPRDRMVAARHRMSIGTIMSEAAMKVRFVRGKAIGTVEENFIARLRPGDVFTFAGRTLEFVRVRDMTAWVKTARETTSVVPHWTGARLALSPELATAVRGKLDQARQGTFDGAEMQAVRPILELQAKW